MNTGKFIFFLIMQNQSPSRKLGRINAAGLHIRIRAYAVDYVCVD